MLTPEELALRRSHRMAASKKMASSKRFSACSETGSISAVRSSVCSGAPSSHNGASLPHERRRRWFSAGRWPIVVVIVLCATATGLAVVTHRHMSRAEQTLAQQQWHQMARRIASATVQYLERTHYANANMATLWANVHADANQWPYVTLPNFEALCAHYQRGVTASSSSDSMLFAPLVDPVDLTKFESFAHGSAAQHSTVPSNRTGVWSTRPVSSSQPHERYHDTTGIPVAYPSSHAILVPILQHSAGAERLQLGNLHADPAPGQAIDALMQCSRNRTSLSLIADDTSCAQLTRVLFDAPSSVLSSTGALSPDAQPRSLLLHPIYPVNSTGGPVLTGVVASYIAWSNVVKFAASDESMATGIHCVLETDDTVLTFGIDQGVVSFLGPGDWHNADMDALGYSEVLSDRLSSNAPRYTLTLYPTNQAAWTSLSSTTNPRLATTGTISLMVLSCLLFIWYNVVMCRRFNAKSRLLDAKRKYMRFVSHEVRTPLNSLCLGLTLLRDEMCQSLGLNRDHQCSTDDSNGASLRNVLWKRPIPPCTIGVPLSPRALSTASSMATMSNDKVHEWLTLTRDVLRNAQSAVSVLNDLLNYDKIEMGQLNLELTVVPIDDLIRRTANEFNLQAAKRKIHYQVHFMGSSRTNKGTEHIEQAKAESDVESSKTMELADHHMVGDQIRIAQCLRNLISNALKFTDEGGSVTIHVSLVEPFALGGPSRRRSSVDKFTLHGGQEIALPQAGLVQIAVTDTGAGMSHDQLEGLFRDGVQFNVNKLQAGQGSGLGLFITKGIVEQHGGTVSVHSDGLKKGSTFTIALPLHTSPEDKSSSAMERAASERYFNVTGGELDEPESHPLRILVVDDSEMNRKLLSRLLTSHGHYCDQAVDGQEAVDMVQRARDELNPYDTILLDYEMPVMNGPTAAREIRQLGCDSFVVGITGNILPEDVAHFKDCGADGVLPKPFRLADLEDMWVEHGVTGQMTIQLDTR